MESFEPLFEAVRSQCSSACWSSGVQLVRRDSVHIEQINNDDIHVRVATHGGLISPAVVLYVADCDWECDCAGTDEACEHVAASAIAVRSALRDGKELASETTGGGLVGYRLSRRVSANISFEREIVRGDDSQLLETTLSAIASGRVAGPAFVATSADVHTEHTLGSRLRGPVPRERMARLIDALAHCADVQLDGEPVQASTERLTPRGELKDAPGGFLLQVGLDPQIREIFDNTVALRGDTLHVMSGGGLTGREREELSQGRFYPDEDATELTTEILPGLMDRIPVDIRSRRLPRTTSGATPRIHIAIDRDGDALRVFPTLVYGEPPVARVDAGKLVRLADTIPLRNRDSERMCLRQLQTALGLSCGRRISFAGEEALAMAERLHHWPGEIVGDALRGFRRAPELAPHIEITANGFELTCESAGDSTAGQRTLDPDRVLQAWREG